MAPPALPSVQTIVLISWNLRRFLYPRVFTYAAINNPLRRHDPREVESRRWGKGKLNNRLVTKDSADKPVCLCVRVCVGMEFGKMPIARVQMAVLWGNSQDGFE